MDWNMISAITGIASLILALSIEINRLNRSRLEKSKPVEKPTKENSLNSFFYTGFVPIGTGLVTFFGLSLSAYAIWNWGDYVIGDYIIFNIEKPVLFFFQSFFTVIIGIVLLILGTITSVNSIRKSNKVVGYIGLATNALGYLSLLIVILLSIMFLTLSVNPP